MIRTDNTNVKPTMEKYGWHTQSGIDDDPTGWMFEGGEDAYYEALATWEFIKNNELRDIIKF